MSIGRALREEGGLLAAEVVEDADVGSAGELAFAVEAIREGWRLHADGRGRVLAPDDPDLALLGGDRLYALGLERLAALGDLEARRALADLISMCARSHAEGRPELAAEAWASLAPAYASDG